MNLQEVFNTCRKLYENVTNDISAMASLIAEVLKSQGKSFDPQITVSKFDLVLQYSLLQVACSDSELVNNELVFIRNLTKYADFCKFISPKGSEVTWEMLYNADVNKVKDLLKSAEPLMRDLAEEVIRVFVVVDKVHEHDFFKDLKENVFSIIGGLAMMDGDLSNENFDEPILIFEVLERIENALQ